MAYFFKEILITNNLGIFVLRYDTPTPQYVPGFPTSTGMLPMFWENLRYSLIEKCIGVVYIRLFVD